MANENPLDHIKDKPFAMITCAIFGLTITGAPALFVAKSLADKEDQRSSTLKEFLSMSIPYVLVSLVI